MSTIFDQIRRFGDGKYVPAATIVAEQPNNYLKDLKSKLTPEQYDALTKPLMYTANEAFGGRVQDYQAQLLMPIDVSKVDLPRQLDVVPETVIQVLTEDATGSQSYEPRRIAARLNTEGFEPQMYEGIYGENQVSGYTSKTPTNINGVPVFANYDASGKLTGYQGDPKTTTWINSKQRIIGNWDANGMPNPTTSTSSGAGIRGFVNDITSDPIMGTIANIAASYFGGPIGVAALGAVQGKSPEEIARNAAISYAAGQVISGLGADPNAVGGVTGPDNIDVGGGWSPATGATAAELAAAQAALDGAVSSPVYLPDLPVGTPLPPLAEPTLDEIISEMAAPPAEIGPELLGEAGGNTFPLDAPLEGEIPLGDAAGATAAEVAAAKAEMAAKGLTFKDALNYVRGGLLVNAVVGDPLGLSGSQPTGGGGPTGFEQVPIPADWRSPTYAASSAPIDLSSIFTDQNLLAGTQWQGLPQQQNVSFNDIFASGQQQTPMGNMVDINQIVSAILGQNTASQKFA
jgi:hypothetical protein